MDIIAIISEYNPLHSGHIYQIDKIRKNYPNAILISIMSGNFVQRGEPAILDKFTRAKYVVDNGIDLVIQLPTIYSLQSAENFALGAMKLVKAINCTSFLSFGIESDNFKELYDLASFQYRNKKNIDLSIEKYMTSGKSYASSFESAIYDLIDIEISKDIFQSNNILALEYIKSSLKLNMDIEFSPIKRQGSNYLNLSLTDNKYNSATAIRNSINQRNIKDIESFVPKDIYKEIINKNQFVILEDYFQILKYNLLIANSKFENITGYEKGIDNLFLKNISLSNNMKEFVDKSISKRYSRSRIQRLILNYLLGISKDIIDESIESSVNFIKILGLNTRGKKALRYIKNNANINIVTKNKDFKTDNKLDRYLFDLENIATDFYNLSYCKYKREMQNKIYIKEDYK